MQRTKSRRRRLYRPEKLTIAVAHPVPAFVLLALGKHPECSVARPRMSNCCRVNQYQSLGSLLRQSSIRFDRAGGIAAIFGWLGRRCQSRNARDVSKDTIISEEKQCQTASRGRLPIA